MSAPDWYAATPEYREAEFSPEDPGIPPRTRENPGPPIPAHVRDKIRDAYEAARALEARR